MAFRVSCLQDIFLGGDYVIRVLQCYGFIGLGCILFSREEQEFG